MPYTVANPSPVPLPAILVVKNGSKMRDWVAASIPQPVSRTVRITWGSGPSTVSTATVRLPPVGIASRAFTARFRITCSSWATSPHTGVPLGSIAVMNEMCSPINRRSIDAMPATTSPRSSTRGSSTCLRLKARSWRVRMLARSAVSVMRDTVSRSLELVRRPRSSSPRPMMTVSRLLKSWAMPPASWPMASIFCDWRSRASLSCRAAWVVRRWLTSLKTTTAPSTLPCSRIWLLTYSTGNARPSTLLKKSSAASGAGPTLMLA